MARKESQEFTLYGDFDGISVEQLRDLLSKYPADSRIEVRSEKIYSRKTGQPENLDYFVIVWDE